MNPFNLLKHLPHYSRRKFKKKYIVIESDDWGLERAVNAESLKWLKSKYGAENFTRWTTDALETTEDLELLFDLLREFKQKHESYPVITANFIMNNIDYSKYDKLNLIPVSSGFNADSEDVRSKYKTGIEEGFIFPQLHGYSHYNYTELEKYFYTDEGKEAFRNKFFTSKSTIRKYLTFLQGELSKNNMHSGKIKEASEIFYNLFGFKSKTIIPPTFICDMNLIDVIKKSEITMIQSSNRLVSSLKKRYHIPYFRKIKGIYWSIRNARLDPYPGYDFLHEQCLHSVKTAFENCSPAIIDFHRVNFSGKYAPEYRSRTLSELRKLFVKIYKNWSDVKFIHSAELNELLWQH